VSTDRQFVEAEQIHALLLKTIEDIEFEATLAKDHGYERRWDRLRAYLLAIGANVRLALAYQERLAKYDRSRPPSSD